MYCNNIDECPLKCLLIEKFNTCTIITFVIVYIKMIINFRGGGRNSSFQFGNIWWQHARSATVKSIHIAILFENKVHLGLFKEGCKAAPRRIFS